VMLYGDDFAMPGDAVLVRLQPCAVDARSALRFALLDCPGVTQSAAFERVRQLCPRTSMRALERDWSCARLDVGLSARGRAGRPKKPQRRGKPSACRQWTAGEPGAARQGRPGRKESAAARSLGRAALSLPAKKPLHEFR